MLGPDSPLRRVARLALGGWAVGAAAAWVLGERSGTRSPDVTAVAYVALWTLACGPASLFLGLGVLLVRWWRSDRRAPRLPPQ